MDQAEAFRVLGDETRLRIFKLVGEAPTSVCVCELVDALELPQYLVSRHLAVLRHAGLVEDERLGVWVGYRRSPGEPLFHTALLEMVRTAVAGPQFDRDRVRLRARVALRQDGRCVVGYNDPQVPAILANAEKAGGLPGNGP